MLAGAGDIALGIGARLAALGLLALVAAVVLGWSSLVPVSLLALGATYAARLTADDVALDAKAPVVAAGLLMVAELAYWSLEEAHVQGERGDGLRRLGFVTCLALLALGVGAALLAAADVARTGGLAVDLVGAAAAAAVLLVVLLGARRTRDA